MTRERLEEIKSSRAGAFYTSQTFRKEDDDLIAHVEATMEARQPKPSRAEIAVQFAKADVFYNGLEGQDQKTRAGLAIELTDALLAQLSEEKTK